MADPRGYFDAEGEVPRLRARIKALVDLLDQVEERLSLCEDHMPSQAQLDFMESCIREDLLATTELGESVSALSSRVKRLESGHENSLRVHRDTYKRLLNLENK